MLESAGVRLHPEKRGIQPLNVYIHPSPFARVKSTWPSLSASSRELVVFSNGDIFLPVRPINIATRHAQTCTLYI